MNMLVQTAPAATVPTTPVSEGVGRLARLMAAGSDASGRHLRFLLMLDPIGSGQHDLRQWPQAAHAQAPRRLLFHAVLHRNGDPPIGSTQPVKGEPIEAQRLGGLDDAAIAGVATFWTQAMTGDGTLPAWRSLNELLSIVTPSVPTARYGLLREEAETAGRQDRLDRLRRALEGSEDPSPAAMPEALQRRASGGGWEGVSRADAIRETLRLAHAVGEADLAARQRWELARLHDPDRAFARLAEPPGPMLAAIDPRAPIPGRANRSRGIDPAHLHAASGGAPLSARGGQLTRQQEAARLRWGQLLNNPSLMRLFGLAFDYEVEAARVPEGFLLLQPEMPDTHNVWTLAKRGAGANQFWPCQREECDTARASDYLTQRDGFANLRQLQLGTGKPRYRLSSMDGTATSEIALAHSGSSNPTFLLDGAGTVIDRPTSAASKLHADSTTRSHGLALLDAAPSSDAIAEDAAETLGASPIVVHDATRLRIGWQMDVRIGGAAAAWRNQMQRHVHYRRAAPPTSLPANWRMLLDPVVEAWIRAALGSKDQGARRAVAEAAVIAQAATQPEYDTGYELVLHESIVAHWTGRSQGIARLERRPDTPPTPGDDPTHDPLRPVRDSELGLTSIYVLDAEEQALEIGVETDIRLRAVYRGGVAPPPEAATPAGLLLDPYVFRREEPLGSAEVLLLEADVLRDAQARGGLGTASPEDAYVLPRQRPLQRCRDIVLRRQPGDQTTLRERRVILPPAAPLDLLERLLATRDSGNRLRQGLRTTDLGRLTKGWPGVRSAGDTTIAVLRRTPRKESADVPRDGVFRPLPRGTSQDWPYFPDPHAAICIIEARWPGTQQRISHVFVPVYADRRWPDPRPIILETLGEARPAAEPPSLAVVPGGAQLPFAPSGGEDRRAHLVRLRLSPGEAVELRVWFVPSHRQIQEDFGLHEDCRLADPVTLEMLLRHDRPCAALSSVKTVEAVHAIAAFSPRQAPPALAGVVGATWGNGQSPKPVFTGEVIADARRIATVEVLASGAALVSGRFDDPEGRSRGRDRRARGVWPSNSDDKPMPASAVLGFQMTQDGVVSLVPEASIVLTWDTAKSGLASGDNSATALALAQFADATPGALYDGKARHITLTPLATPRGAALLRDVDGAPVSAMPLAGTPWSFWLPARNPPSPPASPEVTPVFRWQSGTIEARGEVPWRFMKRTTVLRLRVARPWFSSGEGERLGIVLWPPNILRLDHDDVERDRVRRPQADAPTMDLSALSELDIGPGSAFITRWGEDPIREGSAGRGLLLDATHFANARDWTREGAVQVPLPRAEEDGAGAPPSLLAAVLTAAPRFDPDSEEWYADLPIRLPLAVEPFLRFGLVRWQPHAPDHLRCSTPVTAWGQVQPDRDLHWRIVPGPAGARILEAKVSGAASAHARPLGEAEAPDLPDLRPSMEFILSYREPLPDGGHAELPLAKLSLPSERRAEHGIEGEVLGIPGGLLWSARVTLPTDLPQGSTLHLAVRETERRMAATPVPAAAGDGGYNHVVDSGARFAVFVRVDA